MLTGLSHNTISSSYYQDSAIHLSSTGDHVLYIVSMSGAVNVSIVTVLSLVLNVSGVDSNTTLSLLGSLIDHVVIHELSLALQTQSLGDCSGQSGLTMVNVTDGTNVNMGLGSFKMCLSHLNVLP